jgi:hypothetical protein
LLGHTLDAPELLTVREALKNATTVLLYRVNTHGIEATGTEGGLTVTAVYQGSRGNDLTVRVIAEIGSGFFQVQTFLGTSQVDSQRIQDAEEFIPNGFVSISGTLVASSGIVLSGGSEGAINTDGYSNYFGEIGNYEFNTMALPVADTAINQLGINVINRLRAEEGKKCQVVISTPGANSEAVISVTNGVVLSDGTQITQQLATAWVAGATAGANVNESNTYTPYQDAVNIIGRLSHTEVVAALRNGEFVFTEQSGRVVVEQDINSLATFTPRRNQSFRKNRVIRVVDDVANTVKRIFSTHFIGQVNNDEYGRDAFKTSVADYLETLQSMGAIQNFEVDDIEVTAGTQIEGMVVNVAIQPVDAIEKLYMNVEVH